MSEESVIDDQSQSHYEISLTAGQAFVAFVLLLLSLAASFAFGLMIGKGQADERLVVRKEPAVVNEASVIPKRGDGKIVELGVSSDDFKATTTDTAAATTTAAPTPAISEGAPGATETAPPAAVTPAPAAVVPPKTVPTLAPATVAPASAPTSQPLAKPPASAASGPVEAQLTSIGDQKAAEALAAKLINKGFTSTYVERGMSDKATVWRVRVKFASEAEATAALPRLREFSKDIWITR